MASPNSDLASVFSGVRIVIYPISSLSVMYFSYGTYIFIFGTYIYMMQNRDQRPDGTTTESKLYLGLTVLLFGLCTIFVGVYTIDTVDFAIILFDVVNTKDYQPLIEFVLHRVKETVIIFIGAFIPILLNITAEWMLIHRCYTIWSFDKRIGFPLILGSIIINATGLTSTILQSVGFGIGIVKLMSQATTVGFSYSVGSAVFNLILTLLTAGRIWWIHRQIRAHGIHTSDRLIGSVCRIVLESGMLYPLFQICGLIEVNAVAVTNFPFDFGPIAVLSAGMAPTLIMVRAKLGKNVESFQTGHLSDIQFGDRPEPTTTTTGMQGQSLNIAPTEVVE